MADGQPWTIRALLDSTTKFLQGKAGLDPAGARKEAQILLAHALACRPIDLIVRFAEVPPDEERAGLRDLVKRRGDGCPVAYLVGSRGFYLLDFEVTRDVLIPRPETELLVMECVGVLAGVAGPRVLDLCTGSGCVAVSLAHALKAARVTATDVSAAALEVARRNAARHGVGGRVEFRAGDLFAAVPAGAKFHAVVANPPYIASATVDTLDRGVRDFEPRLALDGGADGLDVYRRLVAGAGDCLEPGGHVLLEIGFDQETAVRGLFEAAGGYELAETVRDRVAGHPRVVHAVGLFKGQAGRADMPGSTDLR